MKAEPLGRQQTQGHAYTQTLPQITQVHLYGWLVTRQLLLSQLRQSWPISAHLNNKPCCPVTIKALPVPGLQEKARMKRSVVKLPEVKGLATHIPTPLF